MDFDDYSFFVSYYFIFSFKYGMDFQIYNGGIADIGMLLLILLSNYLFTTIIT